ncbi:MAG: hypothetical protein KAZ28_03415 [Bacteroidaceae bacterium]|nr:hypothetical protein [Bacteroidaceae bacterium]
MIFIWEFGLFLHCFSYPLDKTEHHSQGEFSGKFVSGATFLKEWKILNTKEQIATGDYYDDF